MWGMRWPSPSHPAELLRVSPPRRVCAQESSRGSGFKEHYSGTRKTQIPGNGYCWGLLDTLFGRKRNPFQGLCSSVFTFAPFSSPELQFQARVLGFLSCPWRHPATSKLKEKDRNQSIGLKESYEIGHPKTFKGRS